MTSTVSGTGAARAALAAGALLLGLAAAPAAACAQQRDSARAGRDSLLRSPRTSSTRDSVMAAPTMAALSNDASAAPLRLTRQEAIREALARNPTIEVATRQLAQARARVTQAVALPEPSLGVAAVGQQGALRPHSASETDLSVGLTIPFANKFRLRGQVARGDVGNAAETVRLQRQVIVFQTNQAYDSLLVALRHRQDLEEARRLTGDFLAKTDARFNAGTAARLDVIKARVAVAQAENDLIANERGVANARAALNRLLGRVLGASIEPADSLAIPATPPDLARLEALALASRPELRGLQSQRQGARAAARLAQQYFLPDLSLSVSRNFIYGEGVSYSSGIGLAFPFFFWQHQQGEVAEAEQHELELNAQYRDLVAEVGQDLRNAYATASTALRQAVYLRDELLPSARDAYRSASASYGLGGSSALEVIDAQRTLLDAQSQYAAALAAVNDAMADLERATGTSLASAAAPGDHDAR